jgi:hypothetical protein
MSDVELPEDAIARGEIPKVVAKITGRRPSPSTVYRWLKEGRIHAFRLSESGPLYARQADVEAYARGRMNAGACSRQLQAKAAHDRIRAMTRRSKTA